MLWLLILGWVCADLRVGIDDLCGSHPTQDILWFSPACISSCLLLASQRFSIYYSRGNFSICSKNNPMRVRIWKILPREAIWRCVDKLPPSCFLALFLSNCAFKIASVPPHSSCFSSFRSQIQLPWQWPSKITSDQKKKGVASAPVCFSSPDPIWAAAFNLSIQYLITQLVPLYSVTQSQIPFLRWTLLGPGPRIETCTLFLLTLRTA